MLKNNINPKRHNLFLGPRPRPVANMFRIKPIIERLSLTSHLLIDQLLPNTGSGITKRLNQVNGVNCKTVPIRVVAHSQLEGRVDVALLAVAAHMQVVLTGTLVCQPVDEPRVGVEIEYDWLVRGEDCFPLLV